MRWHEISICHYSSFFQDDSQAQTFEATSAEPAAVVKKGSKFRCVVRERYDREGEGPTQEVDEERRPYPASPGGRRPFRRVQPRLTYGGLEVYGRQGEECGVFSKQAITGMSAQARFNMLLETHRASDKKSARASGISEAYSETAQFLDDLILAVDENAREEGKKALALKEKLAVEVNTGKLMREEAVSRLKKCKERESAASEKSPRKPTVIEILREDNEKERQMRAEHWKKKHEMYQREKERSAKIAKKSGALSFNLLA